MQLEKELLLHLLQNKEIHIIFPNLSLDMTQLLENKCFLALRHIREIIRDDTLSDEACFDKIERIISAFEELGIDPADRHDFG